MAESSSREFRVPPENLATRVQSQANLISRMMQNELSRERKRFFDVRIDGDIFIKRTDDYEMLNFVESSVHSGITQVVEFRVYYSKSYNYQAQRIVADDSLSRTKLEEFQEKYEKALTDQEFQWKHEKLEKDYAKLKSTHKKLKKQCKEMEAELAEYRGKKFHFGDTNLVEVAGMIIEGVVRRNPQVLAGIPGGEKLAGLLGDDGEQSVSGVEGEASFSPIEEGNPLADIDGKLTKAQREVIYEIVGILIDRPELGEKVLGYLQTFK